MKDAVFHTAAELVQRGPDELPEEFISGRHLIYSSPASLSFNSPGAEGFGVKRAGLSIPGSVMLVVSPICCARNTSLVSRLPGYEDRFFFLKMDQADIVTGRHLKKIPEAVRSILRVLKKRPSVVMVCITCVDALLGTDMDRVCKKAEEAVGLPVRPCYMYALTREGRKPPMVQVRESLYSLLEKRKKDSRAVNILGFFAPLADSSELYDLLKGIGIRTVREISRCRSFEEYLAMAEANFNLILHPEVRPAAAIMEEKLGIPSIELGTFYGIGRIRSQYRALGHALGLEIDDKSYALRAEEALAAFYEKVGPLRFSIGECLNADPFELALSLCEYGHEVVEIFGTITAENRPFIRRLAQVSPETKIYSNLEPTMLFYDDSREGVDITIGRDALYYHPNTPNLAWNSDVRPFGYDGLVRLLGGLDRALSGGKEENAESLPPSGFRHSLTPFAPDQSGAASVLFELGGLLVICDAGGCAGNICGFDEPRWQTKRSALMSAGLRDMDAILGRDRQLVDKLCRAAEELSPAFAAIIGTPVPAVIGTDGTALSKMAQKRSCLPVLSLATNGMATYENGAELAYMALFRQFTGKEEPDRGKVREKEDWVTDGSRKDGVHRIGLIGVTPLDTGDLRAGEKLRVLLEREGWTEVDAYGFGAGLDRIRTAHLAEKNLVTALSGLKAARYLREKYGIPYECRDPLVQAYLPEEDLTGKRVLILSDQVRAHTLRQGLLARGAERVMHAGFFRRDPELDRPGDLTLKNEKDLIALLERESFDIIMGDGVIKPLLDGFDGTWIDMPHFAMSGRLTE